MGFDATDFLQNLFGVAVPVVAKAAGKEPTPEGDTATDDTLTEDRFADQGRCPDVTGREAPKLPQVGTNSGVEDEANEWYWGHVSDEDREYLLGPSLNHPPTACRFQWVQQRHPEPCPWCGGRLRHNPTCCALTWEPTLPFGKHKGKPVSEVPRDYLRWLSETARDLNDDLRTAIERSLSEDTALTDIPLFSAGNFASFPADRVVSGIP